MVKEAICVWESVALKIKEIELVWIKAHVGHDGNELADFQARSGTKRGSITHATPKPWGDHQGGNRRGN